MRFRVYPLRLRGRRLPWRDVQNGPSYVGELVTHVLSHGEGGIIEAVLSSGGGAPENLLPPLYEPVLLGFAPLAFRLRGYERWEAPEGAYAVVQEWHVMLPCVRLIGDQWLGGSIDQIGPHPPTVSEAADRSKFALAGKH